MSTKSDSRTAEFAKLLQFFDHLASRGGGKKVNPPNPEPSHTVGRLPPLPEAQDASSSRAASPASTGSNLESVLIPSDITPVVANLANTHHRASKLKSYAGLGIGKAKRHRQTASGSDHPGSASNSSSSHSRSVSSSSSAGLRGASTSSTMTNSSLGSEEGKISLAKFPLANNKQRPFTFRLMLHKLYATRDDWIQKVQEALEQSKKEYISLAEQEQLEGSGGQKARDEEGDGVENSDLAAITKARRRCKSSVAASTSHSSSPGPTFTGARPNTGDPGGRAVKKRCVGRRKSFDGPLNLHGTAGSSNAPLNSNDNNTKSGLGLSAWVYDAAIAQLDSDTESNYHQSAGSQRRRRSVSIPSPPGQADLAVGKRRMSGTKQEDTSSTTGRKAGSSWGHTGHVVAGDEDEKRFIRKRASTAIPSTMVQDTSNARAGLKRPLMVA
ncbi:hypothetical protein EST38_g4486 [Candolleomyces aberdarensis]|uniref:Uncharacterized protein n=1 Tax=Candolleomyces aberdarensis TaxID=2316362 RepID=A0A4Q2DPJ5_9AGAR|nr:hypothetical protein EST38_g4486 [Candolleomyces aberdarensis]